MEVISKLYKVDSLDFYGICFYCFFVYFLVNIYGFWRVFYDYLSGRKEMNCFIELFIYYGVKKWFGLEDEL